MDGSPETVPPIHPHWYTKRGITELNERLRAPQVVLRFRAMARALGPSERSRLTPEFLRLAAEVMGTLYRKTEQLVQRHLLNYPFPEFDADLFSSPTARVASERYLRALRKDDASFRPKKIPRAQAVPPIILLGTHRSAWSLRMYALFGRRIARNRLENQRGNAQADYCLDIAAMSADTAHGLLEYWWDGVEASDDHSIQDALDTLYHEPLHRVCDLANPFGPQYGPKGSQKEHYWMEEYEPFAGNVERVLISHLASGKERGLLRARLTGSA